MHEHVNGFEVGLGLEAGFPPDDDDSDNALALGI